MAGTDSSGLPLRRLLAAALALLLLAAGAQVALSETERTTVRGRFTPLPARSHTLRHDGLLSLPQSARGPVSATLGDRELELHDPGLCRRALSAQRRSS